MADLRARFEAKVDRSSGECHVWTGAKTKSGVCQMRVDGKIRTAAQIAWELEHGSVPIGGRVLSCTKDKLCVRVDHLTFDASKIVAGKPDRKRAEPGSGSMREVADGKWKLTVDADRDSDGNRRRVTKTVRGTRKEAARALASLSVDVRSGERKPQSKGSNISVTELIDWYITFARNVRGLERTTVAGYREVFEVWLKASIGYVDADKLTPAQIDEAFGKMRDGGMSHSRMNNARSALSGAYKWGRRHEKVHSNPMRGFELPKSKKVPKKTVAPEIDELLRLLDHAAATDEEFAPVLTLAATTGMRRGELSGLRWSRVSLTKGELRVERAISEIDGVLEEKPTKTHDTRTVRLDDATTSFLAEHLVQMERRASECGMTLAADAFVFSLDPSCGAPMRPELMTRRMRRLRRSLGIDSVDFDATILAMRKWTTTELLDAGFNPSAISGRQGHTVQVMLNNYASRRASADQAAADHLGTAVHGGHAMRS